MEGIAAIERQSPSPWCTQQIVVELTGPGCSLVAIGDDGGCLGWCCARVVVPEAELLKIAVDTGVRRRGIAHELFTALEVILQRVGVTTVFLEVRARNQAAIGFYLRHGLTEVGRRPRYYREPDDDGLIFRKQQVTRYNLERGEYQ